MPGAAAVGAASECPSTCEVEERWEKCDCEVEDMILTAVFVHPDCFYGPAS